MRLSGVEDVGLGEDVRLREDVRLGEHVGLRRMLP